MFGVELGKAEAGLGHLAASARVSGKLARGAVGEFGGEGGHGDLDRIVGFAAGHAGMISAQVLTFSVTPKGSLKIDSSPWFVIASGKWG